MGAIIPLATVTAPSPTVTCDTPSHETAAIQTSSSAIAPKTSGKSSGASKRHERDDHAQPDHEERGEPAADARDCARPGKRISVPRRFWVTRIRDVGDCTNGSAGSTSAGGSPEGSASDLRGAEDRDLEGGRVVHTGHFGRDGEPPEHHVRGFESSLGSASRGRSNATGIAVTIPSAPRVCRPVARRSSCHSTRSLVERFLPEPVVTRRTQVRVSRSPSRGSSAPVATTVPRSDRPTGAGTAASSRRETP